MTRVWRAARRSSLPWALIPLLMLIAALTSAPVFAQKREKPQAGQPVSFIADRLDHDRDNDIITASGRVEAWQGERVLMADKVVYDRNKNRISASGKVSILEPTGEVIFVDSIELSGDMKDGVAREIRLLLADNSRMAARSGELARGTTTTLHNAVFSPCALCEKNPDRAPLWQLRAGKVVHDQDTKDITYRDVTLEMFGIPVAYSPYFSHPDPTVKRRSGVLAPEFSFSRYLGASLIVPYYWSISPSYDLTFLPRYTAKEGPAFGLQYRQRFESGTFEFEGSATVDSRNDFRGHVFSSGRFEINDVWRTGFNVARATDDTYLRIYNFQAPSFLTSSAFVEGFTSRSYFSARAYSFQELRNDIDTRQTPTVAPLLDLDLVGGRDRLGGHLFFQAQARQLFRREGSDSLKFSTKTGYTLPRVGGLGDIWNFSATMQGDFYDVSKASDPDNPGRTFSGSIARLFPQASLEWRWPWVRRVSERSYQLIEPIVNLVLAPRTNRQWKIPNENAIDQIFDETNLFSSNRFTGDDRLEGGQRVNYGVRLGLYGANGGSSTLFLGQSYRLNDDRAFADGSALRYHVSDTIAALSIAPSSKWDVFARTRFSNENLRLRQADLIGRVGPPAFNVQLSYVYIDDNLSGFDSLGDRQELNLNVSSRVSEFWTIGGIFSHDLESRKTRLYGARVKYEDECFVFAIDAQRRLYRDRFIEPDTRVLVRILFKQFTGVGATVY